MKSAAQRYELPELPDALIARLRQVLVETDRAAFENVTRDKDGNSVLDAAGAPVKGKFSRGGPFAAQLGISLEDGSFETIGSPQGNAVISSGIASLHAEDRGFNLHTGISLFNRLCDLRLRGHSPSVWVISSGQSCPNCHVKQEIVARDLQAEGLIECGHFYTLYGADYDATRNIAGFNDALYADAMILAAQSPAHPCNIVRHERVAFADIPREIQKAFAFAGRTTAIVAREDEVYAWGREARTDFDRFATAEASAIRMACARNRREGVFESWKVDGALYTTTLALGPLMFAEAGWTNISVIRSVEMPGLLAHRQHQTRETLDTGNADFLKTVAGGYRYPHAHVRVLRDENFTNTAQPKWAEILQANGEQLYNGMESSSDIAAMRNRHTRYRFAAHDICACAAAAAHRPARLLDALRDLSPE